MKTATRWVTWVTLLVTIFFQTGCVGPSGRASYWKNGGLGAASGAGIGATVGGAPGAVIGAGAGGIAGVVGAAVYNRQRREIDQLEDRIVGECEGGAIPSYHLRDNKGRYVLRMQGEEYDSRFVLVSVYEDDGTGRERFSGQYLRDRYTRTVKKVPAGPVPAAGYTPPSAKPATPATNAAPSSLRGGLRPLR